MKEPQFDSTQAAAAAQFNRQSDRYGRSHILAETSDIAGALEGVRVPANGRALDVATGGGHTGLYLARQGWKVTLGDIAPRMLENARALLAEEGFSAETQLFPAEQMPFPDASFDLVSSRVAPHHFSSPEKFVNEVARVLRPGGYFLLIDGSVPDDDPRTEEWLHHVEKWRDPSHGRFLSRAGWETLVRNAGMTTVRSELHPRKQPDLNWYFDTANTTPENRQRVLDAIATVPAEVRGALRLDVEDGKTIWWWPMLTLLARK
jgi:ubiquinone/menaquinone biosynthesis C-methylase UbiE